VTPSLSLLLRDVQLVNVTETIDACRDPKDNRILELAVSGAAVMIVTGDRDLLGLHPFRGIPIVTPAEFVELLKRDPF
jgi:predicted nucleic acid-binding protein